MARALPRLTVRLPLVGSFELNPGPFNVKYAFSPLHNTLSLALSRPFFGGGST